LRQNAVLVVKTREDSALLRSNGDPDENTRYGILRPKRRNAFLIGSLWTTKISCPSTFGHYLPAPSSCYGLRRLVNVRAQFSSERRIYLGHIIEATPDAPDLAVRRQLRQHHIN
jgi:hypothetical protein